MTPQNSGSYPPGTPPPGTPGIVRDPTVTLILILVTCGIYHIYWLYVTSKEVQDFTGDHAIPPAVEVILSLVTGGLYAIYWYYKYYTAIPKMQAQAGLPVVDNAILWFVLMFIPIGGLYALWSFQSELNHIYTAAAANARA